VRFIIEIYLIGADGTENLLNRTSLNTINPAGARKRAQQLYDIWKMRGAASAHVINAHGETVYSWKG
jgi:hypothetical protein